MAFLEDEEENEIKEIAFKRQLSWYVDEFQMNFDSKLEYTEGDKKLAESLFNKMAITLNQYRHEPLLGILVETMNELKKKYPILLRD